MDHIFIHQFNTSLSFFFFLEINAQIGCDITSEHEYGGPVIALQDLSFIIILLIDHFIYF